MSSLDNHSKYKRSDKIMRSLRDSDTPKRITKTPYIINKHDELSAREITANPIIQSLTSVTNKITNGKLIITLYPRPKININ